MLRRISILGCLLLVASFMTLTFMAAEADARAGGGRSSGSRGSRSYSRPATPSTAPSPYQATPQQARPASPSPFQQPQPAGGGFLRSMAGGIVGGMLGGMLFRSLGFGGGGMGGGGIGLFDILLLAGIGYLIYRFVKAKRQAAATQGEYASYTTLPGSYDVTPQISTRDDMENGLAHIRQMDASFDENRFTDQVMDIFFKIQGAWMNRDLAPVGALLTDDMRRIFQEDVDRLLQEKRVNRLENIAVRTVEIAEAWQEQGQDYITALIYANLLDYTTDDATGQVVAGSKTDPVKFEEFWTFTRPVGGGGWKLSGIDQK